MSCIRCVTKVATPETRPSGDWFVELDCGHRYEIDATMHAPNVVAMWCCKCDIASGLIDFRPRGA